MHTRFISMILLFLVAATFVSCQSEQEKLAALCAEIKAAEAMTDDCDKMAQKLAPLKDKFMAENEKLRNAPPDAERAPLIETMSVCLSSYLTISTGTCANHEGVRKATFIDD